MQLGGKSDVFAWKPLLEQVDNRALAPGTILLPLTGVESADALSAVLDQAHLENAYALVAYDPSLTDATRVGTLLQLGSRYATAKDTRKAASCFQSAALLATLSPSLSDPARMDTYQQASAGLRGVGANDAARWVTDQAYLVAQSSPALRRDARTRRLEQVADTYASLGASALAAQARAKSIEAASATSEGASVPARTPFVPSAGKLPASTEVEAAKQTRIAAAKQLVDDLGNLSTDTSEWPSDSVSQLGDALSAEDRVRQAYYDKQIPQVQDPVVQIALLRDQVNWLALKYRVARGGFGKDLVPEWSQNPAAIVDAMGRAWGDFFRMSETQAASVPKPQNANQATEDVVRQELIALRWGWYTGVSEKEVRDALDDVTQKLIKASIPSLHLDAITRGGKIAYLLVPDELYGQGEKALPR